MMNEHPDTELDGKPVDTFFEINILKAYQKVLTRLVDGGTNLNSHVGPILNKKILHTGDTDSLDVCR